MGGWWGRRRRGEREFELKRTRGLMLFVEILVIVVLSAPPLLMVG